MSKQIVVSFEQVSKTFTSASQKDTVRAVSDFSLNVRHGETMAIVGESGSGKSTVARLLMKLESPNSGYIRLIDHGVARNIAKIPDRDFYRYVQMVFQDPYASLNLSLIHI